jgi:uncharacterized protein (DUF1778 family)
MVDLPREYSYNRDEKLVFRLSDPENFALIQAADMYAMSKAEYAREAAVEDAISIIGDVETFRKTNNNFYYGSEYGSRRDIVCLIRLEKCELSLIKSAASVLDLKVSRFVRQTVMNHVLNQLYII